MEVVLQAGDVWLDASGSIICCVADVRGGRVSLCRPLPGESVSDAIARCRLKLPLTRVKQRRIDGRRRKML